MRLFAWCAVAAFAATAPGCSPPDYRGVELGALRDRAGALAEIIATRDTMMIGKMYAEEARLYPPATPPVNGPASIAGVLGAWMSQTNASLSLSTDSIMIARSADLAVQTGTYRYGFDGPRGRIEDAGYTLAVWRRKRGSGWLISRFVLKRDESLLAGR